MKSLSPLAEESAALRHPERAPRVTTVLTTAKLILEDREVLCRVRNLSENGMRIETGMNLNAGQTLRVGLRCGSELPARVAWASNGAVGLNFLTAVDVATVLAAQPAPSRISRRRPARAPRLAVNLPIDVDARGQLHHAVLLNISQSGARLRLPLHPFPDERVLLCIPGLPIKSAAVRWVREAEVGVGFYEPLSFRVLSAWGETHSPSP